ncbi:MAG: hypothetical protein ABI597_00595 [Gammaproteobacteria bacterium]
MMITDPNLQLIQSITDEIENLIPLLPSYAEPVTLLFNDSLPCHQTHITPKSTQMILTSLQRQLWLEGLFIEKQDSLKIKRYKDSTDQYKNDFDESQFLAWVKLIEENTVICSMENHSIGKGVFVPPGKILPKNTFIPSSGIIKFNPTIDELGKNVHCSALQDLDAADKQIYGLINPEKIGGLLDLINHAPTQDELAHFTFKKSSLKKIVSTANLRSKIRFFQGYAIMGVEVVEDIVGGTHGKQLLWSYANPCEYLDNDQQSTNKHTLFLFDNRDEHQGEIINPIHYRLKEITIFIDSGELIVRKVATITRWELMERNPESGLVIATEDPFSSNQSAPIQSPIQHGFLQTYLKLNPLANRVIINLKI